MRAQRIYTILHCRKAREVFYPKLKILMKNTLSNSFLIFISLFITILACEFLFYIINTVAPNNEPIVKTVAGMPNNERLTFFKYHPVYGLVGLANVKERFNNKIVTHNAKGLRGQEYDFKKKPGTKRILFSGDSQTWGWAIADHETTPHNVSMQLNSKAKNTKFEILNFGVTGYGIGQSYLRLISEGFQYDPDFVVFTMFTDNDFWETTAADAWGIQKPYIYEKEEGSFCVSNVPPPRASGWPTDKVGYVVKDKMRDWSKFEFSVVTIDLSKSNIATFFKDRNFNSSLAKLRGSDDSDPIAAIEKYIGCVESAPQPKLHHWKDRLVLSLKILNLMRNAVEKNGAKFIVVIKPTQEDYDKNSHGLNYSTALSGLKDGNYDFIDLFEVAKNLEFRSEHLFIQAGHLSAVGNRMVANEVTKHIQNLLSQ